MAEFGCAVASAGDVNGDGFGDLAVGQCELDVAGSPQAAAYVYLGTPSGVSTTPTALPAPAGSFAFGVAARSAGDVNGDGYGDLAVGPYIYLGSAAGIATSPSALYALSGTGSAIGSADVNGDGYGDLLLGGYDEKGGDGSATLYLGGPSGLSTAPISLQGPAVGSRAGFGATVGIADVNGDGYADALVGAYRQMNLLGAAYLYMGGPGGLSAATMVPSATPAGAFEPSFSVGLGGVGDVDGDGHEDFVVGAYTLGNSMGGAYFFAGGPAGLSLMPVTVTDPAGGYFGNSIAGGGDIGRRRLSGSRRRRRGRERLRRAGPTWFRGGPGWTSTTPVPLVNPNRAMGTFGWAVAM